MRTSRPLVETKKHYIEEDNISVGERGTDGTGKDRHREFQQ